MKIPRPHELEVDGRESAKELVTQRTSAVAVGAEEALDV